MQGVRSVGLMPSHEIQSREMSDFGHFFVCYTQRMHIFGYKGWNHKLTKYSPSEAINMIIKDAIKPILKTAGYKKVGRTWTKDMGDFMLIITVYGDPWNGVDIGAKFDISYNIYVPKIHTLVSGRDIPKHPSAVDCNFGQLIPGRKHGIPWEIFDNTNMAALKADVSAQLKQRCIDPFTLEDVKAQLISNLFVKSHFHVISLASLCAEMGDIANAKRYFDGAMNDQTRPQVYRDKAEKIARHYKLS